MKQELVKGENLVCTNKVIEKPSTKGSDFLGFMKPSLKYFIFVFMSGGGYLLGEAIAKFRMCQGMMGIYCIIPQLFFMLLTLIGGLLIVINIILDLMKLYRKSTHKHIWNYFILLLLIFVAVVIFMQLKNQ